MEKSRGGWPPGSAGSCRAPTAMAMAGVDNGGGSWGAGGDGLIFCAINLFTRSKTKMNVSYSMSTFSLYMDAHEDRSPSFYGWGLQGGAVGVGAVVLLMGRSGDVFPHHMGLLLLLHTHLMGPPASFSVRRGGRGGAFKSSPKGRVFFLRGDVRDGAWLVGERIREGGCRGRSG